MFFLIEGFRRGGKYRNFLGTDRTGALIAFFVGHQHRVTDPVGALDAPEYRFGIGQLRDGRVIGNCGDWPVH